MLLYVRLLCKLDDISLSSLLTKRWPHPLITTTQSSAEIQ